jgi:hypothetical protein
MQRHALLHAPTRQLLLGRSNPVLLTTRQHQQLLLLSKQGAACWQQRQPLPLQGFLNPVEQCR